MMRFRTRRQLHLILLIAAGLVLPVLAAETDESNWPQFRGPGARGIVDGRALPVTWSISDGTNVKWKIAIPGLAHSSPVIWDDAVFLTTSISGMEDPYLKVGLYGNIDPVEDDTKHKFVVYRIDAASGKIVWERTAFKGVPKIKRHQKSTHANPTPATDGKHVIALFGSEGLYAYDMDGKLLWRKDLGVLDSGFFQVPTAQWGFGSSPIIHDGRVIVQADVQEGSFLAAFDVKTGKELWRTDRNDVPTWSTPTAHVDGSRSQVIVNGYKHLGGYDLETGKELWRMRGTGDIPIPTPYVADGLAFFTSAHGGGSPIYAVRTTASGDVSLGDDELSNEQIAWSHPRGGSYMPTTLVYGDLLYVLRDNGVLGAYDIKSGERRYEHRLGNGSGGFTASVVAGDDKIFFTAEMGEVYVVKPGPEFELLATNEMDEICMATPAIAGGTVFYRTRGHLVALAAK